MDVFLVVGGFAESLIGFRLPLILALRERGLLVHVAAPALNLTSPVRRKLEGLGIVVHDIPMSRTGLNPFSDLRTIFALYVLMAKIRPTWMLGYTIKPVVYGSLAGWIAKVPFRYSLITGLGYAFQGGGRRGFLRGLVQRLYGVALSRVNKVFFQNPDDETLFRERGILKARTPSVVVNGSGVDVDFFKVAPLPDQICFLFIARLLGDKGVREFALASGRVRAKYQNVRCVIVGWIDENPNAISSKELDSWTSRGFVDYLGKLDDVRPAISDCSVYVLPSYREGTPRTVLEAMSMGRAIITTNAPGCRETVVEGRNGVLIPVQSTDALEGAMLKFVENPELVGRMGASSRHIAVEKYDVHKVNGVMLREMGVA